MNAKHTLGRWESDWIWQIKQHLRIIEIKAGNGQTIAWVNRRSALGSESHHDVDDECEANARLIAEAGTVASETGLTPRQLAEHRQALLEALKETLDALYNETAIIGNSPWITGVKGKAKAAIALATGKEGK